MDVNSARIIMRELLATQHEAELIALARQRLLNDEEVMDESRP